MKIRAGMKNEREEEENKKYYNVHVATKNGEVQCILMDKPLEIDLWDWDEVACQDLATRKRYEAEWKRIEKTHKFKLFDPCIKFDKFFAEPKTPKSRLKKARRSRQSRAKKTPARARRH